MVLGCVSGFSGVAWGGFDLRRGGGALLGSGRFLGTWIPEIRIWVCTDVTP